MWYNTLRDDLQDFSKWKNLYRAQKSEYMNIFSSVIYNLGTLCFSVCHHNNLTSVVHLWYEFYLGNRELMHPNTPTLCLHTHLYLYPDLKAHSGTSHIKPVHSAMGTEEITLAWLQWPALSHFPILTSRMYNECYLCDLESSPLSYEHTHRHTHTISLAIKGALPVCVTPGFCFLHGL